MYSSKINIKDIGVAREFVSDMTKYMDVSIMLKSGDYCIDGHSIIGLISLDFSHPIIVEADGDITDELIETLNKYAI